MLQSKRTNSLVMVSARPTNHQRDLVHPVCSAPACLAGAQEANQRKGQHSPAKKPLLLLSLLLFLLFIASKQQHSVLLSKHHCSLSTKRLSSALLFALQDKARMVASPLLLFRGCLVLLALWRWQRIHPNKNQTSWVWIGCLRVGSCLRACSPVGWCFFRACPSRFLTKGENNQQPACLVVGLAFEHPFRDEQAEFLVVLQCLDGLFGQMV